MSMREFGDFIADGGGTEIEESILDGFWDDIVERRYAKLHPEFNNFGTIEVLAQNYHRATHPDGPFGYEYCSRCTGAARVR